MNTRANASLKGNGFSLLVSLENAFGCKQRVSPEWHRHLQGPCRAVWWDTRSFGVRPASGRGPKHFPCFGCHPCCFWGQGRKGVHLRPKPPPKPHPNPPQTPPNPPPPRQPLSGRRPRIMRRILTSPPAKGAQGDEGLEVRGHAEFFCFLLHRSSKRRFLRVADADLLILPQDGWGGHAPQAVDSLVGAQLFLRVTLLELCFS